MVHLAISIHPDGGDCNKIGVMNPCCFLPTMGTPRSCYYVAILIPSHFGDQDRDEARYVLLQ